MFVYIVKINSICFASFTCKGVMANISLTECSHI